MDQIHRLDEAANFLMLVSDEEKGLTQTCNLKPDEALNLLQPLHAMIDVETQKTKHLITSKFLSACEDNCHCGLYSDLAGNKQLKNDLFIKAQSLPKRKLVTCAELTAKWFCNDSLLQELRSQLSSTPPNAL